MVFWHSGVLRPRLTTSSWAQPRFEFENTEELNSVTSLLLHTLSDFFFSDSLPWIFIILSFGDLLDCEHQRYNLLLLKLNLSCEISLKPQNLLLVLSLVLKFSRTASNRLQHASAETSVSASLLRPASESGRSPHPWHLLLQRGGPRPRPPPWLGLTGSFNVRVTPRGVEQAGADALNDGGQDGYECN